MVPLICCGVRRRPRIGRNVVGSATHVVLCYLNVLVFDPTGPFVPDSPLGFRGQEEHEDSLEGGGISQDGLSLYLDSVRRPEKLGILSMCGARNKDAKQWNAY